MCLFSDRLAETRDFDVSLFGWRVDFESGWFVHLQAPDDASIELGILRRDHEIVPPAFAASEAGVMVTLVVPNVDDVHRWILERFVDLVEAPRNLLYGQRRMLLRDPNGILVDLSSECPPAPEFLASRR